MNPAVDGIKTPDGGAADTEQFALAELLKERTASSAATRPPDAPPTPSAMAATAPVLACKSGTQQKAA